MPTPSFCIVFCFNKSSDVFANEMKKLASIICVVIPKLQPDLCWPNGGHFHKLSNGQPLMSLKMTPAPSFFHCSWLHWILLCVNDQKNVIPRVICLVILKLQPNLCWPKDGGGAENSKLIKKKTTLEVLKMRSPHVTNILSVHKWIQPTQKRTTKPNSVWSMKTPKTTTFVTVFKMRSPEVTKIM